jgi:AbrB family looped-hinge helix DNA binding protein
MKEHVARIGKAGRLVIPAELRRALALEPGAEVVLRVDESGLHLQSRRQALARAQALVRRHVPAKRKLVSELLAERRRDARR